MPRSDTSAGAQEKLITVVAVRSTLSQNKCCCHIVKNGTERFSSCVDPTTNSALGRTNPRAPPRFALHEDPVCSRNGSGHRSHPPPVRCKLQLACSVPPSGPAPHQRHHSASYSSPPQRARQADLTFIGNGPGELSKTRNFNIRVSASDVLYCWSGPLPHHRHRGAGGSSSLRCALQADATFSGNDPGRPRHLLPVRLQLEPHLCGPRQQSAL